VALAGASLCFASAASGQNGPGFEIVNTGGNGLEVRFHGVPLKSVRADDNQNALALDFNQPVDPAIFDRLNGALPGWVAMAYSNYDNGVIRAARPVTFLTRPEIDGFSLRMEPRGPVAPMRQAPFQPAPYQQGAPMPQGGPAPYPPQQQPYPPQGGNPPPPGPQQNQAQPPIPFAPYETYGAARNYYGLQYAVNRGSPVWEKAHARAAMRGDSEAGAGVDYESFHGGTQLIKSHGSFKVTLLPAVALLGSIYDYDARAKDVRTEAGTLIAKNHNNRAYGSLGLGFEMGGDTELTLEGVGTNYTVGGKLGVFSGSPNGFLSASLIYHQPFLETPEAIQVRGIKDEANVTTAGRLGRGLWGSLSAKYDNYGVHGHANMVQTAGWNGNLRWDTELMQGLFAGIAYDGQGEYRLAYKTLTGTAPSPYVPLSIRNLETHAMTASLSTAVWDQIWFDAFGGYVYDRYAKSGGGLYGASLRVEAAPGFEIELGARHSNISLQQGELGGQTTAGISLNLGFGGSPRSSAFSLW